MSTRFETQGLQELLSFPFRAPNARSKLVTAGLISFAGFLVPVLPTLFLLGYAGLIMRRMINEDGEVFLPEWDNWNEMLALGAKIFGAALIYWLPLFVLIFGSYFGVMIPAMLDAAGTSSSHGGTALMFGGMFVWMCGFGVAMLLSVILWVVFPAVLGHVVARNSFTAAFHFREWWRILKANWGGYFVTVILMSGVYMATLMVAQALYMTVVLCFLLPFALAAVMAYVMIIGAVVFARAYIEGVHKLPAVSVPGSLNAEGAAV